MNLSHYTISMSIENISLYNTTRDVDEKLVPWEFVSHSKTDSRHLFSTHEFSSTFLWMNASWINDPTRMCWSAANIK